MNGENAQTPQTVRVADYPQLRLLCWNRRDAVLAAAEAFALYEANWRHVDPATLDAQERGLIEALVREYGCGVLNA